MSCKIVTAATVPAIHSVVWPTVAGGPSQFQINSSSSNKEGHLGNSEAAMLRSRIAELENSIAVEVRAAAEAAYRDGEKSGRTAGRAEVEPVLERVSKALGEIASLRSRIRRETEKDLVFLSIAIAKRVLHRELAVNPEAIQALVKTTLESVQVRDICRVRMSPEHQRYFTSRPDLLPPGLEVVADTTLPLGGLVVETKRGDLDASVESQLSEISRGFADRIGKVA